MKQRPAGNHSNTKIHWINIGVVFPCELFISMQETKNHGLEQAVYMYDVEVEEDIRSSNLVVSTGVYTTASTHGRD